jgi:hypothetical protein
MIRCHRVVAAVALGLAWITDVSQITMRLFLHLVSNSMFSLRNFGAQVTPPAPILKALPKIFAHNDKVVRAEGTLLAHALYQFIGPAIEPWLADLKPVQVKELKESFDAMESEGKGKGTLKPERLTRQQAREVEARGDAEEVVAADGEPEGGGQVLITLSAMF